MDEINEITVQCDKDKLYERCERLEQCREDSYN